MRQEQKTEAGEEGRSRTPSPEHGCHSEHTGHISIGGQDGDIEGKIGGIFCQNRGQIGGKKGEFPNKIEGKINKNKGTHYFNLQDVWRLFCLAMPPNY